MLTFKHGCYEAYTNSDLTEGKGRDNVTIAFFTSHSDAIDAAKGKGVMGSNAYVRRTNVEIVIYENYKEYKESLNSKERETALSKLTEYEKKLLGLIK